MGLITRVALGSAVCLVLGLAASCSQPTLHGISGRSGDAEAALEDGVRRLLEQPAVGFRYLSETSGSEYSVTMTGTLHLDRDSWIAKGRATRFAAGGAEDFELRSIGRQRWLGISPPDGGRFCWFPIDEDRELESLPAVDAGIPGFFTVLKRLQGVDWQLGEESRLTARLGLPDASLLASTFTLTPSELAPPAGRLGAVAVTVGIEDGVVHDLLMTGSELAAAFKAASAPIPEEAALDLESRDVRLSFDGPTLPVRRPDPSRVFDGVHQRAGCPAPAQTNV